MNTTRILPVLIVLALGTTFAAAQPAERKTPVLVGAAKVDATPERPVVLAGYGGRTGEHEGIDTQLWARAMVIGDYDPAAIVVLDNCGVPAPVTARLAKRLARHGITPDRLIVAATHTHNAPTLVGYATVVWAGRTTPEQDEHIEEYTALAIARMEAAVVAALKAREPMRLEWAQGRVTFGGNRRVLNKGTWAGFGFQRSSPVDHSLPVLAARDANGKVRAVWANYACHCTTVGSRNRVGGDWAGYANTWMENGFPDAVSLMTIGCGADIGPQPSGNLEIAEQHGRAVAEEVTRLLSGKTKRLVGAPVVASRRIKLPLSEPPPREHWEKQLGGRGFYQAQAKAILAKADATGKIPTDVEYPLAVWKFGEELAMVFLAGEVVVDYSVRLNRELDWSRLWITAWSNDMPGYIPSRRVLAEGGYEADFSQVYYAQPGRYAPEVEGVLVTAVKEMLGKRFAARSDQDPAPFHRLPSGEAEAFGRIARWAAGEKPDEEAIVLDRVRRYVHKAMPAIERVTRNDGEETEWHNFAGDFTRRLFIRQQSNTTELQWQAPAINSESDSRTLCFTGGVGWSSQPQTDGFALVVDGEERLRFDVTLKPSRWRSKDGSVELVYLPTWTSDVDSAGFFFLDLSRLPVKKDDPLLIGVRSLGEGSLRWFAIDAEQQVPDKLKLLDAAISVR